MSLLLTSTRRLLVLRRRTTRSEAALHSAIATRRGPARIPGFLRRIAEVDERTVGGHRVVQLRPRPGHAAPLRPHPTNLIFTHGGTYAFSLSLAHWAMLHYLIGHSGVTVTVPFYGLAPDHHATDAYALLDAVYDDATAEFGDRILLGGDSAGGGLALGQAMRYRDQGRPAPRAVLLISPWLDVTMNDPGVEAIAPLDHMLATPGLIAAGRLWAGDLDPRDPLVSPLFGDFAGLPPVYTYQGDHDLLYPDAEEAHRRILKAGGESVFQLTQGGFHDFPGAIWIPEARRALADMAEVLRA